MVNYENFYYGSEDPLFPRYNTIGYQVNYGELGVSLDPRTANQLRELNTKVNPGVKNIEIQGVSAEVFESIPEEHLEELKRLTKLVGVKPSLHAPVIEASGITQQGFDEANRQGVERQLTSAVLRAHQLDPEGNIPVTFHSTAGLPELMPRTKEGEIKEGIWVIDPDSGKIGQLPKTKTYFPEQGKFEPEKQKIIIPEKELEKINNEQWLGQLSDLNRFSNYGEEIVQRAQKQGVLNPEVLNALKQGTDLSKIKNEQDRMQFKEIQREINHGQIYLRDSYRNLKALFDKAWGADISETDRERLRVFANKIAPVVNNSIENDPVRLREFADVIEDGIKTLGSLEKSPQIYKPLNDFVIEKSAETFANVATSAFNKFGNTAPMVNIENPPAGAGISRAEDLKALVESARGKFTQKMIDNGMSKTEAKQAAEKMIGATWDVGHINMLRKQGFEDKDLIKQTEIIAPFVKHVHLSDNFGFEHTELPMGMGDVPLKGELEKLKKAGFKGRQIVEAGNWWQHFAEQGGGNPLRPTIQNFDSPLYSMATSPTWSQLGAYGNYYSGFGPINPPLYHQTWGASFSRLPVELGGNVQGTDTSRFAGTPNQ